MSQQPHNMSFSATTCAAELSHLRRVAPCLVLLALMSGCATSGMQAVDRSFAGTTKGYVEFRMIEGAEFSIMREPVTVYITREGEKKALGFVGSDTNWSPAGYVRQLIVTEAPGSHTYGYTYQTMGKTLGTPAITPIPGTNRFTPMPTVKFLGLEHCQGVIAIDVADNQTTPVTFSLGPKEVEGTLISTRLDPSQFKVETGTAYRGEPQKVQK